MNKDTKVSATNQIKQETELAQRQFNLSKMVEQQEIAVVIRAILAEKNDKENASFFDGIVVAYTSWFMELHIPEAILGTIKSKLDRKLLVQKAAEIATNIKPQSRLITPEQMVGQSRNVKLLLESFDKMVLGKG